MYKIIHCDQGTDAWLEARLGIITASNFDKVITKTGRASSRMDEAVNMCVAERLLGGKDDGFQSDAMIRGQSLEWDALKFFNYTYDYNFSKVGFLRAIDENGEFLDYGCSPDGLDEKNKVGLEMKAPLSHTHVSYLLNNKVPDAYIHQIQGSLLVTGFNKWIFGSYHPDLPCLIVEVYRDELYINTLRDQLSKCSELIKKRCLDMENKMEVPWKNI